MQGGLIQPCLCPSMTFPRRKKDTEQTQAAADQLLDYLAIHPDATIRYHASDMLMYIHSNDS